MQQKISVDDLKINTAVSNDVYTEDAKLIIKKGTVVTEKILERLSVFDIEYVFIRVPDEEDPEILTEPKNQTFEEFKKGYTEASDTLHNSLNNIVERNSSSEEIMETVDSCLRFFKSTNNTLSALEMLGQMKEFSDCTYLHSLNVGMIAAIIGKWSGMSESDQHLLVSCGLFHDIGKLTIPPEILNKPGKLTYEEFKIMKSHTIEGYKIIRDLPLDEHIKNCALMHHEKIDGSGYPQGLKGDKIDEFSKILTIADVYDALTAARIYRGPMCPFDAIEIFEKDGYQLYETKYLLTFLQNVINSYMHSQVVLTNGEKGEIIMMNTNKLSRPVIHSGLDYIDLSKKKTVKIEKII